MTILCHPVTVYRARLNKDVCSYHFMGSRDEIFLLERLRPLTGTRGRQRYFNKQLRHPLSLWHLRYLGLPATFKDKWRLFLMDSIHIGLTERIVLSTKKLCTPAQVPSPGANHKQDLEPCGAWLGWIGMLNNCFHREAISNYDPLIDSVSCLGTIMLSTKRWDNVVTSYKSEHCLTHY